MFMAIFIIAANVLNVSVYSYENMNIADSESEELHLSEEDVFEALSCAANDYSITR